MINQPHAADMPKLGTLCKGNYAQAVLYSSYAIARKNSGVPSGTNLKQLRVARDLSQTALAELIGTTLNMYGKLERGQRRLNMDWLKRISTALNVGMDEIVGEIEDDGGEGTTVALPSPSLGALRAMLAEHYLGVMGRDMPAEMLNDLAERMLDSVENWKDDPAAASDPQVARSVARQINRRYAS